MFEVSSRYRECAMFKDLTNTIYLTIKKGLIQFVLIEDI